MAIQTINPSTQKVINTYEEMSPEEAETIARSTHEAFLEWRDFSYEKRAIPMQKIASLLKERKANTRPSQRELPLSLNPYLERQTFQKIFSVHLCLLMRAQPKSLPIPMWPQ